MPTLQDPEFGTVTLRRSRLARAVRLRLNASGAISISLPNRTPIFMARRLLDQSRLHLRRMVGDLKTRRQTYQAGDVIGKSHTLQLEIGPSYRHRILHTTLLVSHPPNPDPDQLHQTIHTGVSKALRQQANAYLPRRLRQFAETHNFAYQKLRFSSAGTRWGSCSSAGTISLNIWLMQLPHELIDYVLVHELCHTRHLNHSPGFWQLVESICPDFRTLKRNLKAYQPNT